MSQSHETSGRILLVGGTSQLGRRVADRLLSEGSAVRIMTRHPENVPTSSHRLEVVYGDLRDRPSLNAACRGVTKVFAAAHSFAGTSSAAPERVDEQGHRALIDAARLEGVQLFVYTSILGAHDKHLIDFFRIKRRVELYLADAGMNYSVLRAAAFMESWARPLGMRGFQYGFTFTHGRGDNPMNFVSVDDVATVALAELNRSNSADNRIIDVCGPQNLSFNEIVAEFERVTGRKNSTIHVPLWLLKVTLLPLYFYSPDLRNRICACLTLHESGREEAVARSLGSFYGSTTLASLIPEWIEIKPKGSCASEVRLKGVA